jgi:hypothetical protein
MDFPKEALDWLLPDVSKGLGRIQQISFVREEPKKRQLTDAHLSLDMPILYTFKKKRVLLWLVVKLFDYKARDYYDHPNPVVKILLPKMDYTANRHNFTFLIPHPNPPPLGEGVYEKRRLCRFAVYEPEERTEVIRQAYRGLFELVAPMLFDKYVDFIDVYAEIREDEREAILHEMTEQEDTAMLAQYIRDKGFQEGWKEGRLDLLERLLTHRFGPLPNWGLDQLAGATLDQLNRWAERALEADSIQAVLAE